MKLSTTGWRVLLIAACFVVSAIFSYSLQAAERWIVVGDETHSVVSGPVKDINRPDLAWPAVLQAKSHHQIINLSFGDGGYKYKYGYALQQVLAASYSFPTGIILAFGTWDWLSGQNLTLMRQQVKARILEAKRYGAKVVCMTPPYRTDERIRKPSALGWTLNPIPGNARISYATAIAAECALQGAGVIYTFNAPLGLAHVGPLNAFTRGYLLESGHAVLATFVHSQMISMGYLPPL